jgi:mRNA interferase RelE/StbE
VSQARFTVDYEAVALGQAMALAKIDPEGVALVLTRIDLLADDPRPPGAFSYGADAIRLHVGFYRVLAFIYDEEAKVLVTHIGRAS